MLVIGIHNNRRVKQVSKPPTRTRVGRVADVVVVVVVVGGSGVKQKQLSVLDINYSEWISLCRGLRNFQPRVAGLA